MVITMPFITEAQFEDVWTKIGHHELGKEYCKYLCCKSADLSHFRMPGGKLTPMGELFTFGHELKTRVVNIYRDDYDVYIGRASGSIWGNPFKLSNPSDDLERYRVLMDFVIWLKDFDPPVLDRVESLHGKILGCHCAPRACHGHVYKKLCEVERSDYRRKLQEMQLSIGVKIEDIKRGISAQPKQVELPLW